MSSGGRLNAVQPVVALGFQDVIERLPIGDIFLGRPTDSEAGQAKRTLGPASLARSLNQVLCHERRHGFIALRWILLLWRRRDFLARGVSVVCYLTILLQVRVPRDAFSLHICAAPLHFNVKSGKNGGKLPRA